MSQDLITSQLRTNAIISTEDGTILNAVPKILVYDKIYSADDSGARSNALNSIVTNAANFPTDTLLYVHGIPTTDDSTAVILPTASSSWASVFGGDIIIKGTLFTNVLRDIDGNLIDFSSISYTAPQNTTYLSNPQPTSSGQADGLLDAAIAANAANITTNTTNIALKASQADLNALTTRVTTAETGITNLQTELDTTQAGAGLQANGTYVSNDSSNYISNNDFVAYNNNAGLTKSLFNADVLLDAAISANASSITTNTTNIALKASQADLNALTTRVTTAENDITNLENNLATSNTNITSNQNNITQINTKINNLSTYTGLSNQTYTVDDTLEFLSQADFTAANLSLSLFNADKLLDAAILSNKNQIDTNTAAIALNTAKVGITNDQANAIIANTAKSGITNEQSAAIVANTAKVGITNEQATAITSNTAKVGITNEQAAAIVANTAKTGITNEQSAAIIANTAKVGITPAQAQQIIDNESDITNLQGLLDTHELHIGLNNNGVLENYLSTNFLTNGDSLKTSIENLDSQIKVNETSISSNLILINDLQSELNATQTGAGLNVNGSYTASAQSNYLQNADSLRAADFILDSRIKTNADAIENLTGGSAVLQLANLKATVGTDADGDHIGNYSSTNFISNNNDDGLQDSHHQAIIKLDAALGNRSIFNIQGINDANKADGKVLQYNLANDEFEYVDAAAGAQGPAGPAGAAGADGADFTFISTVASKAALNNIQNPSKGDAHFVETDESQNDLENVIYIYDGAQFVSGGSLKGATGPQGEQGIQGIQGEQGEQGLQGLQGEQGEQGLQGDAGAAGADGVGIVSTVDNGNGTFTINYSDNTNFTTADLTGPQGLQGDAGLQGEQGEAGPAGPQGDVGPAGQAGADAPTITDVSISGTVVTTTFSDNSNDQGTFTASIGDLSDVDITTNAPTNGQVLKWDNANSKFIPGDDINGGGGGGVNLLVTDNTTSVAATTTLDVQQLAAVTDSGGNEATLVGIIGNAEDADYTDGLFTDFTATTTIGTAIDRFNEVLKALAPSPAPELDQFDVNTANSLLQNIKLSFGSSNDQSAEATPYVSVSNTKGFTDVADAIDVNQIFPIQSESGNYRLGVYTGSTTIEGTLNEDVLEDAYTNNVVNFSDNSFSNGDQGTLELWLNNQKIHEVDLTNNGAGNYLNADGSGFFDLTAAISGKFSSNTAFDTFKHRQGSWRVHSSSQRNGWNYVQVKHVINNVSTTTGFAEWVNDSDNTQISVTNKSLSLNMAGSKYISGIRYHTSGTATYTADIDNFYKYVYKTDNMTFTESPDAIANFNSVAISDIDTGNGEDHTKQINLSQTSNLLPISNRLLNQSLTAGFSLNHPIKTNIATASTNETVTGILLDNVASDSTVTSDSFNDEQYRQTVENNYSQTGLSDANNTYAWDSTQSLVGADAGHNTGLIVYNSKLYSPKSSALPNSGNFSTLSSSYANPDYSSINNNDVKVWIRKFKNNSGSTAKAVLFSMSKNNSDIVNSNTPNSDEINLQFKVASKGGNPPQEESAWLTVANDFDLEDYLAGTLTACGDSTHNGNIDGNTINNKIAILKDDILSDEYILVKITASAVWAGYVDSISVDFNNVVGNIVNSPEVEHIDLEQTGVSGNLSFGATNTVNNFTNYTSDINTLFDLTGNKSGIFDANQSFTGFINDLTTANGNNYPQYAFGGGQSNEGTLKLHVNGQDIHTIDLASRPYLTGNQLNGNGSGFTNLTEPLPSRDANNRTDFGSLYRTSKFVIATSDQRLGYNFAKIIHVTANGDEESNTIEWINDNNTDLPDFTNNGASTYSIDSNNISSTETNSLSGVSYYKKVTNVPYQISVKNLYKNIYSDAADAVTVSDTENNVLIKQILLNGTNNNAITNNGSHTLPGNSNSGSKSLPAITAAGDNTEILVVSSIFEVNYQKSIPDLDNVNPYDNMNDITINTTVKHPLTAANGKTTSGNSEVITSNKFLQYSVSTSNQTYLEEDFSNETRRIPAAIYATQASATGASWNSSDALVNDLMVYDSKLIYPDGDFRDINEGAGAPSIYAPAGNPNYENSTGTKSFYRIFQNNTQNSKTGFTLELQGNGSTLVDQEGSFSATNIKVSVKIPETAASQSTGYLNIAKDFETGQYTDSDGSLSGNLSSNITNGQTTSNTITFGQKFLQPNEYFVLRVEANENWTGYISNITVDWS